MTVAPRIDQPYRVRFDECTPRGYLRSSGYLRYAQEVAWVHSEAAGFDRAWYRSRNLTWLVRCAELDVTEGLEHGESVLVSTEVLGFRRVWARRRSEFRAAGEGRPRAVAVIDWVLLGASGSPVRVPQEIQSVFERPPGSFTPAKVEFDSTPGVAAEHRFRVRHQDLDPMGHVNNAAYLDYFEEALGVVGARRDSGDDGARGDMDDGDRGDTVPRRYRLEYVAAATRDEELVGSLWRVATGWAYRLSGTDGRELLRAVRETDPMAWVGG